MSMRIGHGYDVHKFGDSGPITICGVKIDYEQGLLAHSDGDVALHALCDALLGALALGDIGKHFPDTDAQFKGADSRALLLHVMKLVNQQGYQIGNIDVTLILERPKVAKFKPAMKANIVKLLGTTDGRVNIKARTHEQVDSVGELRSLSCHVVVTLEKKVEKKE